MKKCITCKVEKELSGFSKRKDKKDGLQPGCKACCKKQNQEWRKNNREYVGNKLRTTEGKYRSLNSKAKFKGLEMKISFKQYTEILKNNKCYYCDISLIGTSGSSLNRIDNNKGYLVSNVKPCCGICNKIMNNFSIEELSSRVYKIVARMKKLQEENK